MAARLAVAALDAQGLAGEQVRQGLRTGFAHLHVTPIDPDVGQERRLQPAGQFLSHFFRVLGGIHVAGKTPSGPAHLVQQIAVDAGADAERKQPRVP